MMCFCTAPIVSSPTICLPALRSTYVWLRAWQSIYFKAWYPGRQWSGQEDRRHILIAVYKSVTHAALQNMHPATQDTILQTGHLSSQSVRQSPSQQAWIVITVPNGQEWHCCMQEPTHVCGCSQRIPILATADVSNKEQYGFMEIELDGACDKLEKQRLIMTARVFPVRDTYNPWRGD